MRRSLLASVLALAGCAVSEDVGKLDHALSQPGPWDIPADVAAAGDTQYVSYTGAGPWVGPSGCTGGLTTGAARLRDWIGRSFPQVTHVGGYSCRSINGDSTTMSVHATGRALDIHIPTHAGDADNDLGDPVGNWFIEHAEEIGIQYIIWDRWTWNASRAAGSKERMYGGAHPHHDHLHVELSVDGGAAATPWFSGPMAPPEAADCPAIAHDGATIEETSPCFAAYGPATYWRRESAGHGGAMLWTNAFENDTPSNWARWHLDLEEGGEYAVEIYVEPAFATHRAARYELRHGDVEHALEVDLTAASGWVRLGAFAFAPGGGQHLSVYDHSATPVPPDQHIPADAVRLVRVEPAAPMPEPDPAVYRVVELEARAFTPIAGGDPTIDDDPPPSDRTLVGGCSAGPRSSPRGWPLAIGLALALVALRRSRRRR